MPWPAVITRIESNDRRSCAVLRMNVADETRCGWKVTVYVSVARESCTFSCAYGLLAEHTTWPESALLVGNVHHLICTLSPHRDQIRMSFFRSAVVTHRSTKLNCPLSLIYRVIRSFNPRRSPDA